MEWWTWQVAKELAKSGKFRPHIICTGENDPSPRTEIRDGVHFYRITLSRTYKRLFQKWTRLDPYGYAARAANYCLSKSIRIVHTQNSPSLHQQVAKKLKLQKTILHMHNEKPINTGFRADLVLVVSNHLAHWYEKYLLNTEIRVITNGIDRNLYLHPSPPPDWKKSLPTSKKVILYAGRISPEKGVHILAEAFALLAPKYPELHLVIVGGRSHGKNDRARYADKLEAFIKPFTNQVQLIGSINPSDMHKHYQAANLLVVPSVSETFGMVCLEGMAAGIPVLASPAGGLPEFVKHGKTGFLIEKYGDASHLAAQILDILMHEEMTKRIATAGQAYALENHNWSIVSEQLARIYDSLLNNDRT